MKWRAARPPTPWRAWPRWAATASVRRQGVRRPAGRGVRRKSMTALGVDFHHRAGQRAARPPPAAMIAVTPDGQRSMNTYLGACRELTPDDVDEERDRRARRSSISKAICGTRTTPRRPRARPSRRRKGAGGAGRAVAVRQFLRRPLPRRIPASDGQAMSTSCSPMKTKPRRCSRPKTSTAWSSRRKAWGGIAALTRSAKGCVIVEGRRGA